MRAARLGATKTMKKSKTLPHHDHNMKQTKTLKNVLQSVTSLPTIEWMLSEFYSKI
jgi:hypothetical protein